MKKKVIFFSRDLSIGGMEKALLKLLNSFNFDKYEVTLVLENKAGVLLEQLDKRVFVKEYRLSDCPVVLLRKIFNALHRMSWAVFYRHRYDFSCNYATYSRIGSKLALIASENSALYVHSDYYAYFKQDKEKVKAFFHDEEIENLKKIIFVSKESMEKISGVYPEYRGKFEVISNLIDDEAVVKMAEEEIKEKKPENRELLLFVGRLEEESKKLSRLLKSFQLAAQASDEFELWMIGNGKDYDLCQSLIREYALEDRVKLVGEVVNPYPYMKMADCVIMTSDYEGYPVTYNECMVLNVPIMTTIPVSDEFVDIRDYAVMLEKDEVKIAEKILSKSYKTFHRRQADCHEINKKRLEAIEGEIICRK